MKRTKLYTSSTTFFISIFCWMASIQNAFALRSFVLTPDSTIYGTTRWVKINKGDTLLDIAREFDLGYNQITSANPGIDPWIPPKDRLVLIPWAFVLPQDRISSGIVVNLAEMRLYYFFSNGGHDYFITAPVGIGQEGFLTELGVYTIKSKTPNPTWVVPASIRAMEPNLPPEVPPGPDNPLGDYIFRLSRLEYGIHGTNKPFGVGRRVSHGCIRMYPEDIAALYPIVPQGTMVRVTYEPIKVGWGNGKCWVQVFDDFDNKIADPLKEAMKRLLQCETAMGPLEIDFAALDKALKEKSGVPMAVASPKNGQ
ncbi:MAG: L,D-transpeptidase family protein [Dissulfurimicrobium sp.]|uniref:L,D-transpeptidase family protein n=1 Tax=Dissulfurimicrobium TaxID=1769732 RepID=UPI001EDC02B7|nr:L,D-transpeptidase family protein [Dissulfurimicrobium hydrothermale]UKL14411.1 L,D-transpeptidase family protein [Dissulfurimicrobium hydrothermale]